MKQVEVQQKVEVHLLLELQPKHIILVKVQLRYIQLTQQLRILLIGILVMLLVLLIIPQQHILLHGQLVGIQHITKTHIHPTHHIGIHQKTQLGTQHVLQAHQAVVEVVVEDVNKNINKYVIITLWQQIFKMDIRTHH
jgi:hypothetical protein